MFDLQYFSYIIIFILRSFPHPNYNLNSDIDCCDTQLTALIFKSKDWLAQWQDIISKCNPFWDSKPELFSDIACLQIPYQPCIVLFGKKIQVPPPRTGVNYACTSLSCQPALEYSKVDIFCCINM
jgi:hypothetical protein